MCVWWWDHVEKGWWVGSELGLGWVDSADDGAEAAQLADCGDVEAGLSEVNELTHVYGLERGIGHWHGGREETKVRRVVCSSRLENQVLSGLESVLVLSGASM